MFIIPPVGVDTSQTEFNTIEKVGGSTTHTLTNAQMPNHTHGLPSNIGYYVGGGGQFSFNSVSGGNGNFWNNNTGGSGSSAAHNNLQPYITVYFWKRAV